MRLAAVLTGTAGPIAAKSGQSGIFKRPVSGPVAVDVEGLASDVIIDTAHHGGADQAVYLMGDADYAFWSAALGRALEPGTFGENLLVEGLDSAGLSIGDRLTIGGVVLELTGPRIPCAVLAVRMGDPTFAKRFLAADHPGAYARVIVSGTLEAGTEVGLTPAPPSAAGPAPGIVEVMHGYVRGFRDAALTARLVAHPATHGRLRRKLAVPATDLDGDQAPGR